MPALLGHMAHRSIQLLAHGDDLADEAVNLIDKRIERTGKLPKLISTDHGQTPRQIALARSDFIKVGPDQGQGTQTALDQQ
ncbi:hypothetical protein D3C84_906120 [compost metagenome]